jgi:hypothetical protein
VRAGRSRSSRPPETSASADAEEARALVAVKLRQLIGPTLTEIVRHRKGLGSACPRGWHNRRAMNPTVPRLQSLVTSWWPFALVTAVWVVVATQQITLPGVYMDAVNPDYLAVRVLNPNAEPITAWLLGSNDLLGRFPILISYYHGSQQFWLGLPLFWLFGTTVAGLRLTHAVFALGVLAALYAVLARGGLRPWQAALACAALAVDPAFSYAFRTQSYITLAPTAWLFLSLYSLQRAANANGAHRWLAASGALYGLATVGYFIYAFYFPAMLWALWLWGSDVRTGSGRRWTRTWLPIWLAGLAAGAIFYPAGYALIIWKSGGLHAAWLDFQHTQQALGAFNAQVPPGERLAHVATMIGTVVQNWYHHELIFGEFAPLPGATPKTWLLVAGPVALWLYAEAGGRSHTLLRVLVALPISFVALAMGFGTRLSGHHFVPLLPLLYAALAVALCAANPGTPVGSARPQRTLALVFVALATLNIVGQVREGRLLATTRGIGLYSDAINRLGADLAAMEHKPFVYFPDWGLSLPVAFLTRGTVGMDFPENFPEARRMLCEGRDVAFAVIDEDRAARVEAWQRELRWSAPLTSAYRQADGKIVFEIATFKGQRDAPACVRPD